MTDRPSYYDLTDRSAITPAMWDKAKRVYAHNYSGLLPADRGAKILDLGCSEGIALDWLIDSGFKNIVGVDSDPVATEKARGILLSRNRSGAVVCSEILDHLKREPSSGAGAVFMFNVVEHMEKKLLVEVVTEIHRVLKPGGVFVAQTGNFENPFNYGLFADDFTHSIAFTEKSLRQVMLMCGFGPDSTEVRPVRYKTTLTNWPLQISEPVAGLFLRMIARSMRIRMKQTSPLIYSLARK